MEKFYIIGSVFVSICLAVPPYANGQYGSVESRFFCSTRLKSTNDTRCIARWDPLERDCWYTSDNQGERLAWQVNPIVISLRSCVVYADVSL